LFRTLRLRWKVRKLLRLQNLEQKKFGAMLREPIERRAKEEVGSLLSISSHSYFYYQEQIARLHSVHLMDQAIRMFVPIPSFEDEAMWKKSGATGEYFMTEQAINHLRTAIRAERKAVMWVPGIVGLIGAAIGLAAIVVKK
jgi:hypothetical protein